MAEIEKLSFYVFLFNYKSWENYPMCGMVFGTIPNQNPTLPSSAFQNKTLKTHSGLFENNAKGHSKMVGKF